MSQATELRELDRDRTAVILVDHGSRREESNRLLLEVAAAYRATSNWLAVEPAHMELAEPSIATAFRNCVDHGANLVVVFPYFLSPGRHWHADIPRLTAEAAAPFPEVRHLVTAPLGLHPLMIEVIGRRIEHCLEHAAGNGEACEICQPGHDCQLRP